MDATDPLEAFARDWLQRDAARPSPLGDLLAAHPQAASLLTEALLELGLRGAATGRPDVPEHDAPPGRNRLGPYSIVREIGRGGQATVFEAIDTRLGRRVALKVLRSDVFGSRAAEERFRAEAATTSRLDHPGVCPVYEIGEGDDLLYLAMRFVEGQTLAQCITSANAQVRPGQPFRLQPVVDVSGRDSTHAVARRVRPWLGTLLLFESAAMALHAAHTAGINHRDVKPGNMMVQHDGTAVLLDFGLAGDLGREGESLTRTGEVFGTPAYMPPEQCRDARAADYRSDIWALGATLYEALTGRQAFDQPTAEAKVRKIVGGYVPNPRRAAVGLPWEFAVVVQKAMDPDPQRRYASAAAFADDLRRLRESHPILGRRPSFVLRTQRWLQRNPMLAALLAVTIGGGAAAEYLRRSASAASIDAEYLSAPQVLAELRLQPEQMRPLREHRTEAAKWLDEARALVQRRGAFAQRLSGLRSLADPATPAEVADMQRRHPASRGLSLLAEIDASAAAGLGNPETVAVLAGESAQRAAEAARLREQLAAVRPFRFADARQQVLHDTIAAFLVSLEEFAAGDGPLATIEREMRELAVEEPADWDSAISAIADSPRYGGMRLRPQGGLSPLRCNPGSGLWEFLHVRSGKPPRLREDGSLLVEDDTGIVLVLVPGGSFLIGSQAADPAAPAHNASMQPIENYLAELVLDPYFLAVHEVTQAQWRRLGGGSPSWYDAETTGSGARYGVTAANPVENVPWRAAMSVLAQSGLTMPTEAQWEVAARGGVGTELWVGEDSSQFASAENLYDQRASGLGVSANMRKPLEWDDGWAVHAPVGSLRANPLGFHDMLGNVQEWCLDEEAYPNHHLLRPGDGKWLSPPRSKHTLRGGLFTMNLERSLLHMRSVSSDHGYHSGVRAARRVE